MYSLHMKVYVKVGEGEDATYGCSERRIPLTAEELADPAKLDALANECLESISDEPEAEDKSVVAVSYEEYYDFERKRRMAAMFGGMRGLGGLAALLGLGDGEDEEGFDPFSGNPCAGCDAEDCPSRTAEFSENLN